jgi:mono/diheme cytochrome c family protein
MKTSKGSRLRWAGAAGVLVCGALLATHSAAESPTAATVPKLQENSRVVSSLDGATLYTTYCAVCHGAQAKGDGPMSKMLTAKTPDLTRLAQRHGGKFPRAQVDAIISGEAASAGHGTREMPI